MPFFTNVFGGCKSADVREPARDDYEDLRERVMRLEIKFDALHEILRDIKMSIEVIRIRLLIPPQIPPQIST